MNKKSIVLITGGTGSFGRAMSERLIKDKVKEIRIFSRDEKKQDDMRREFNDSRIFMYFSSTKTIFSYSFK